MIFAFLLVSIAGFLLWRHVNKRGKNFVRAVEYLTALDHGLLPEEANRLASHLFTLRSDPDADRRAIDRATSLAGTHTCGRQMPFIQAARAKGYVG